MVHGHSNQLQGMTSVRRKAKKNGHNAVRLPNGPAGGEPAEFIVFRNYSRQPLRTGPHGPANALSPF